MADDQKFGVDLEDDCKMTDMTASYSEISFDSQPASPVGSTIFDDHGFASRPDTLELGDGLVRIEGTLTQEGDMVSFVAEDLETKIKLASPVSRKETPVGPVGSWNSGSNLYKQALMPQMPSVDPSILNDLEAEAKRIATSVDTLTENLAGILHSVSALTVECLETYRDAVCKTCDSVDSNIKAMYQLMAKTEELSKSMKPIYTLAEQIKELKRLLDLLENAVNV
ncbi:BLOC-1-related complex subunit 6 [Neocloeon triangulifer]|uniref:BLOC-1-related complex subunit 6 n=1 Tax=Neocloeon triangulifer TaxID=2078957 RepID=UPI00286EE48B|nr:BLOC-1-related complex subunit 6 [Neocloeon triangulifer]